jgi:hypothetical protein
MVVKVIVIALLLSSGTTGGLRPTDVVGGNVVDLVLSRVSDMVDASLGARFESATAFFTPLVRSNRLIRGFLSNARASVLKRLYGGRFGQDQATSSVQRTGCNEDRGTSNFEAAGNDSAWHRWTAQNEIDSYESDVSGCNRSE